MWNTFIHLNWVLLLKYNQTPTVSSTLIRNRAMKSSSLHCLILTRERHEAGTRSLRRAAGTLLSVPKSFSPYEMHQWCLFLSPIPLLCSSEPTPSTRVKTRWGERHTQVVGIAEQEIQGSETQPDLQRTTPRSAPRTIWKQHFFRSLSCSTPKESVFPNRSTACLGASRSLLPLLLLTLSLL